MGIGKVVSVLGRVPTMVGPLFTKELLVTSRRPRYYVLRFAYAAMLGLFISLVWLAFVEQSRGASATYRIAYMSEMGKQIVSYIVCFQFAAAQLVAIVLLSSAISEEIYQRTLVPILTTPIGYGQIVTGKFLGKLLHIGILLAISLPLMGMVRVLGGVPWGYLLAGVAITVTAAMLTGAIAMFFSILCRRAYLSILASLGASVALYGMVGLIFLIVAMIAQAFAGPIGWNFALYLNPVAAMVYETWVLSNPAIRVPGFYWPVHCVLVLGMTFGVLKLCEVLVRKMALRKAIGIQTGRVEPVEVPMVPVATGPSILPVLTPLDPTAAERARLSQPQGQVAWRPAQASAAPAAVTAPEPAAPRRRRWKPRGWNLRRMIGSPIVWRELRKPLLRDKVVQIVATCAVLFYLLYTYAILGASGAMDEGETQSVFVTLFLLAGMLCTAMDSATSIAPERQARTWPSLLSTPVSDWHILLGKAGGTAFRCLPVWMFLGGHVLIFTLLGFLHPVAVIHVLLLAIWAAVFLTGSGVYFSTRHRRATTAVLMNMGLAVLLWALIPAGAGLLGEVFGDREIADGLWYANPVMQATVVAGGATDVDAADVHRLHYDWPAGRSGWGETSMIMLLSCLGYCLAGYLLAWRAKALFRRNVFQR